MRASVLRAFRDYFVSFDVWLVSLREQTLPLSSSQNPLTIEYCWNQSWNCLTKNYRNLVYQCEFCLLQKLDGNGSLRGWTYNRFYIFYLLVNRPEIKCVPYSRKLHKWSSSSIMLLYIYETRTLWEIYRGTSSTSDNETEQLDPGNFASQHNFADWLDQMRHCGLTIELFILWLNSLFYLEFLSLK